MFAYRAGFPGWKTAARLGMPLKALVEVSYDKEAQVYVATCDDFLPVLGIATEAETTEKLKERLDALFEEALCDTFKTNESWKVVPFFDLAPGL